MVIGIGVFLIILVLLGLASLLVLTVNVFREAWFSVCVNSEITIIDSLYVSNPDLLGYWGCFRKLRHPH
jgi:hypothetical protein